MKVLMFEIRGSMEAQAAAVPRWMKSMSLERSRLIDAGALER
jgi:hypothetical protein